MRPRFPTMTRLPEGGAGSGGAGGGTGGGEAAAGTSGGQSQAGGDGAAGAGASAAPEGPYRPEGLAQNLYGENDRGTIDNLARALAGYRQRDNERGVSEDAAAYTTFADVSDDLKPYYATIENDGFIAGVAETARAEGVTTKQFQAVVGKFMASSHEMGLLEPPLDVKAERAALLPDAAKSLPPPDQERAIDRRMGDNLAWLKQMEGRGLAKDAVDHMTMMLGDSAKGHAAIEFFRAQMTGASDARPSGGGGGGGGDARADLARRAALPENISGNAKFDKASHERLMSDYQRIVGD